MLLVDARFGPSKIHGYGLIAREPIPEGTVYWKLIPGFDAIISEEELLSFSASAHAHMEYYGFYDACLGKYVLCADDDKFTNHSDTPNSRYCGGCAVAIRDIAVGEEITDDYRQFGKILGEYRLASAYPALDEAVQAA
jgi:uncharacterized protein